MKKPPSRVWVYYCTVCGRAVLADVLPNVDVDCQWCDEARRKAPNCARARYQLIAPEHGKKSKGTRRRAKP